MKPSQMHDIDLTKEQQLQEEVDWLIKGSGGLGHDVQVVGTCRRWCTTTVRTVTSARPRGLYDILFLSFSKFFVLTCL
jgi:hypothetical protein